MDFSTALPTFLITLREGVEAALVVGIVLALLEKAQQSKLKPWVYAGVGVGVLMSAIIGALFIWIIQALGAVNSEYTSVVKPLLEALFSVLAIAMLSWMLIWMTKQAKLMKSQVEGALSEALTNNYHAGWGVFTLILIAVLREGFETVLFIAANFQQGVMSAFGAIAGLAGASAIGIMLFKLGVKINLRQFFQVMGVFLILIVAGLVISALKNLDQGLANLVLINPAYENVCFYYQASAPIHSCILGPMLWNTSNILPEKQFPGIILKSLFGYRERLFLVQAIGYILFLVSVGSLYFGGLSGGTLEKTKKYPPNTLKQEN